MKLLHEPNESLKRLLVKFPTTHEAAYEKKLLCVDAYPRSGNSYATLAATDIIATEVKKNREWGHADVFRKLVHHTHNADVLRESVRSGIPTLTVVRSPLSAIFSAYRYYAGEKGAFELCEWWRGFYLQCLAMAQKAHFMIVDFEDIANSTENIARCLIKLGLIHALPEKTVPVERVLDYIREEDKKHGRHYKYRAAAPIDREDGFRKRFDEALKKIPRARDSLIDLYARVLSEKTVLRG